MKVTASGYAHKKVEFGQESDQWSILAIYTTQLPTLIKKVLKSNFDIVQCYAKGSGTNRVRIFNEYHIGAKIESREQSVFVLNLKEKTHRCFLAADQRIVLEQLNEYGIVEPQIDEICLRFSCPDLVEEINEAYDAELPSDVSFRGRFVSSFCRDKKDRERVMEHVENKEAVQNNKKKIRKLQLKELIDYNQIYSLPHKSWHYWVNYSRDVIDDILSPHEFVAPIKRLFGEWAGCEFYKSGSKNELVLVDIN